MLPCLTRSKVTDWQRREDLDQLCLFVFWPGCSGVQQMLVGRLPWGVSSRAAPDTEIGPEPVFSSACELSPTERKLIGPVTIIGIPVGSGVG